MLVSVIEYLLGKSKTYVQENVFGVLILRIEEKEKD